MGGNGPLLNLANFKEYSANLNYKNLIYFFTETNDLFYDIKLEKNNILVKYLNLKFTQELINQRKEINFLLDEKSNQIYKKYNQRERLSLKKYLDFLLYQILDLF